MSIRKTEEDYVNTHRVFYRLIRDYAEGRLDKGRILYRAVVVGVDTKGGQLESRPPNPPNSIRARVYTKGLDANTPDSALTIFYPFLPAHMSPPIDVGEHVYIMFEDEQKTNGVWLTTVPAFRDLNYSDPHLKSGQSGEIKTSNVFEGTTPSNPTKTSFDEEFGGVSFEESRRKKITGVFSTQSNSFFKNKKVLLIGDSLMESNLGIQLESAIMEKGAKSVFKDFRPSANIVQFSQGKKYNRSQMKTISEVIQDFSPDVIIASIGSNDRVKNAQSVDIVPEETIRDIDRELQNIKTELSLVKDVFFLSPILPSTSSDALISYVVSTQETLFHKNFIKSNSLFSNSKSYYGLENDKLFNKAGSKEITEKLLNLIEQRYA